jgi:hypothetical protein
MPFDSDTIPGDFPLTYVVDDPSGRGHLLYVKEPWRGPSGDGEVRPDYWQMGCLLPGCDAWRGTVLTTNELLQLLDLGHIVGTHRDGITVLV